MRANWVTVFTGLWAVFFMCGMSFGFWVPALTNILGALGMRGWVPAVFMMLPVCALISPLIGGALADQRVPANRLLVWSSMMGSLALAGSFGVLQLGWHPLWFMLTITLGALSSGPLVGLLTTISMTHLVHGDRQYPLVRLGFTLGWVAGGLLTSYIFQADTRPVAFLGAAGSMVCGGLLALTLPHTPPLGRATTLRSQLGMDAFSLLKQRDHFVFFLVTAVFSIPLSAFYMYGPEFLKALGGKHPAGTMTVAQILEVVSMLVFASVMTRFRVKVVLLWALGLSALRFAMSANAGVTGMIGWHIGGIALHGLCYTFYFVTAQVFLARRVDPGMRGQAQGFLSMVGSGVGPLLGAFTCGWLRHHFVQADGSGWAAFWAILAGIITVCFIVFAVFYRGLGAPSHVRTHP